MINIKNFLICSYLYFLGLTIAQSQLISSKFSPTKPNNSSNISYSKLIFSEFNRCNLYPRCLLYQCCPVTLLEEVERNHHPKQHNHEFTHSPEESPKFIEINPCLYSHHNFTHAKSCEVINTLNESFSNRKTNHPWINLTITTDLLSKTLFYLPPTAPWAYTHLQNRNKQDFKVLYLIQGERRFTISPWYSFMKDVIFLSYKQPHTAYYSDSELNLYYPNSSFSLGRAALYAAGRLLELRQGWLYDYMVFCDDDATLLSDPSSPHTFESELNHWRPALGGPNFSNNYKHLSDEVTSVGHIDFIYIAYHREVIEVLYPFMIEHEATCVWASQLAQLYEAALVYRNHIMVFSSMHIGNKLHRPYPRGCGKAFPLVLASLKAAVPKHMRHCEPPSGDQFRQGVLMGKAHNKTAPYHLMPTITDRHSTDHITGNRSYTEVMKSTMYSDKCGNDWHPLVDYCCTADILVTPSLPKLK